MIRRKWYLLSLALLLSSQVLNACSFSVRALATPAPGEGLSAPASGTPALAETEPAVTRSQDMPTAAPALATPAWAPIGLDTVSLLETFQSFTLEDTVRALAFTTDGAALAAAGGNTTGFSIRLWDVATGTSLGDLDGHTGIVWDAAFSPDGELLASVAADETARIWDWRHGRLIRSLDFPGQAVRVVFSPDGQTLAVGGVDEPYQQIENAAIWTYAVRSWELVRKYPEFLDIGALAFSPRGGTIIGGGTSRNVQVWRTGDGSQVFTLNHAHQVTEAAISPDGSTAATATCESVINADCTEGGVWLWDLPQGKLIRRLGGFSDLVENVAFSADGSILVAASRAGTLRFYNTADYENVFELALPGGISAMALSPDGGLLATGNLKGEVRIWKIAGQP